MKMQERGLRGSVNSKYKSILVFKSKRTYSIYMGIQSDKSNTETHLNWTAVLKALADESRLQIIHELLKQDLNVQDLSSVLDIQSYNISKHLKVLEANGLVKKRKDGVHKNYYITKKFRARLSNNNQVLDLGCCKFVFGNSIK